MTQRGATGYPTSCYQLPEQIWSSTWRETESNEATESADSKERGAVVLESAITSSGMV